MRRYTLTLAYHGASLVGWQRQPLGVSVQGLLEDALAVLDKSPVTVIGAGRTDAGVHALAQVAAFTLRRDDLEPATLVRALNAALPDAVRVLNAAEVPSTFHPRFDAASKRYRYRIWNADVLPPFERGLAWHIPAPQLDVERMAAAAGRIEGQHDFAAFQGTGATTHTTERRVLSSRIAASDTALVTYDISGEGFLRHMVRNIVGTLVEIGRGKRPPEWMDEVLASRDRTRAGRTAPAEGLFLVGVDYGSYNDGNVA